MKFCTYVHCKPDLTPFYVGKGTVERAKYVVGDRRNRHHQRVVAKYGAENIIVDLIMCRSEGEAFLRECLAIKALRSAGVMLANATDGGEGVSGLKWGRPSAKRGVPLSAEVRAKLSAAQRGKTPSAETRAKISAAGKGKPKSAETKARISAAAHILWATPAVREKRIAALRALPPVSTEARANMSEAQKRRYRRERNEQ